MQAAAEYLPTIDEAGSHEIDTRLYPQSTVLGLHILQEGAHRVDAHKTVDAESAGEEPRNDLPEMRYSRTGP